MSAIASASYSAANLSDGYYTVAKTLRHSSGEEFDVTSLLYVSNKDGEAQTYSVGLGGDLRKKIGTMARGRLQKLLLVKNNGVVEQIKSCVVQVVKPMTREERESLYNFAANSQQSRDDVPGFLPTRPLRTNYNMTQTGFITDMKKGFKKAVDEGKKMYKEGKEMYKEYKKGKEKKTEK